MASANNNLQFLKIRNFPDTEVMAQEYSLFAPGNAVYNNTFPSHLVMTVQPIIPNPSADEAQVDYNPQEGYFANRAEFIFVGGVNKLTGNSTTSAYHQINIQNSGAMDILKESSGFGVPNTDGLGDHGWSVNEGAAINYFTPRNSHPLVDYYIANDLLGNAQNPGIIFRQWGPIQNALNDDGILSDYNNKTSWQYINRVMIFNYNPIIQGGSLSSSVDLATPSLFGAPFSPAGIYQSGFFFDEQAIQVNSTPPQNRVVVVVEMRPDFILGNLGSNPDQWNIKVDLDGYTRWIEY